MRAQQLAKLERLRAERDQAACDDALARLTAAARASPTARGATGLDQNLLKLSIDAARARATVGEISAALEEVFGRHTAAIRTITGVYRSEVGEAPNVAEVRALVDEFAGRQGRRPRILVAKMGQDGHDRGQKVIATAFADLGFDVDVGPLFQTPEEVARQAVEADVHVVGVSTLAAGHLTLVPQLQAALPALGRDDMLIVVGGVIPPQDFDALRAAGAAAIFPPGTVIADAAVELLDELRHGASVGLAAVTRRPRRPYEAACWPATGRRSAGPSPSSSRPGPTTRSGPGAARRRLLPHAGGTHRVGITGVPGAGKSTFIDALGMRPDGRGTGWPCSPSTRRRAAPAAASSATRPAWPGSPSTTTRSSGRRRTRACSAASPGRHARRSWSSRPPASTSCSSRRSASASPRSPWPTWSTRSCC